MFEIKISVNKKTLFTIEGQNITPGEEVADYKVTVTKESDKSKHEFVEHNHWRKRGLLALCAEVLDTLVLEMISERIPRLDEYSKEPKEWKVTRPPHVTIKGKR